MNASVLTPTILFKKNPMMHLMNLAERIWPINFPIRRDEIDLSKNGKAGKFDSCRLD